MKILVTGCNGQLGNELRDVLEVAQPGVTDYVDIAELDITDAAATERFIMAGNYTHIVNCAAYTAVDRAEEEKSLCTAVNTDGIRNIAEAASKSGAKVLHISTDYVFDGTAHRPYSEGDKPAPVSHYGVSKRRGETALLGFVPDAIIVRTGWLYSSYGHNFVKTMLRLARTQGKLRVVADQIGTPTYAADLAAMIVRMLTARQWIAGTYHFSNQGVASWYDFTHAIVEIAALADTVTVKPIPTDDYPTPAERPYYSVLDKSKIRATYGNEIAHWRDALKRCMARIAADEASATPNQ